MQKQNVLALFALLLFFSLSMAAEVPDQQLTNYVKIIEDKESGTGNSIDYVIGYNCTQKIFYLWLSDRLGPLENVSTYLFYGQYSYQLISSAKTNNKGISLLPMVGKNDLLTNIFVMRAEKQGYKNIEVEMLINCSGWNIEQNLTNESHNQNQTTQNQSITNPIPEFNTTPNFTINNSSVYQQNVSQNTSLLSNSTDSQLKHSESTCTPALIIGSLMAFLLFIRYLAPLFSIYE